MPANYIGLRFIMRNGAFLQWIMSELEAQQILSGFSNGNLKPIIGNPSAPFGGGWAVRTEDVISIHTINGAELAQLQQQMQQPAAPVSLPGRMGTPFGGTSGL